MAKNSYNDFNDDNGGGLKWKADNLEYWLIFQLKRKFLECKQEIELYEEQCYRTLRDIHNEIYPIATDGDEADDLETNLKELETKRHSYLDDNSANNFEEYYVQLEKVYVCLMKVFKIHGGLFGEEFKWDPKEL